MTSHRPSLPYIRRRCNSERFVAYKHISDGKGTYHTSRLATRPLLDLGPGQLYSGFQGKHLDEMVLYSSQSEQRSKEHPQTD